VKLLFDQNLSHRLPNVLENLFHGSSQVRLLHLDQADDTTIWSYAAENGYCIVTLDGDFADLSALRGSPPKVVWLRCGNRSTTYVHVLLRMHANDILAMDRADDIDCLAIG